MIQLDGGAHKGIKQILLSIERVGKVEFKEGKGEVRRSEDSIHSFRDIKCHLKTLVCCDKFERIQS